MLIFIHKVIIKICTRNAISGPKFFILTVHFQNCRIQNEPAHH